MNLTTKTVRGIGWTATSRLARVFMQFVITAILARLLTPSDFGLLAMVAVFSNFLFVFSDFGLTSALVQKSEISEELLSSVFWIALGIGALLTLSFAACAPLIAAFYSEQRLVLIIVALSTAFFITSCGNVQTALLTKRMNFKALAIISIVALGTAGSIGIFLAFAGYGVWSLVWNTLILFTVTVILSWIYSRWVPHFSFSRQHVKAVTGFGANLTGFQFVNYFSRNADNLLIGKFLGSLSLGFYNLAYNLLLLPLTSIYDVVGGVLFPALSLIHEDKKKVRDACITVSRYVTFLIFPLMASLIVAAPQFVRAVYGHQWVSAVPLVQILAFVAIEQSIAAIAFWIYMSQGRTDILFKWSVLATTVYVISFAVGLRAGVVGVAIAYTIAVYLLAYPSFAIPFRLIDLKVGDFLAQLRPVMLATLASAVIAFSVRVFLVRLGAVPNVLILVAVAATGLLSYLGLIFILDRNLFTEGLQLVNHLRYSPDSPTDDEVY